MVLTILMDPNLLLAILGVVLTAMGVVLAVWNPFKKPEVVALSPDSLEHVKKELNTLSGTSVQVGFFPTDIPALELTNLGSVGVHVRNLILSSDILKESPVEMYPLSLALLGQERQLVYVSSQARQYFNAHLSALYETGRETRPPVIRFSFRCEATGGQFDTTVFKLAGKYRNGTLVDLKPFVRP